MPSHSFLNYASSLFTLGLLVGHPTNTHRYPSPLTPSPITPSYLTLLHSTLSQSTLTSRPRITQLLYIRYRPLYSRAHCHPLLPSLRHQITRTPTPPDIGCFNYPASRSVIHPAPVVHTYKYISRLETRLCLESEDTET